MNWKGQLYLWTLRQKLPSSSCALHAKPDFGNIDNVCSFDLIVTLPGHEIGQRRPSGAGPCSMRYLLLWSGNENVNINLQQVWLLGTRSLS